MKTIPLTRGLVALVDDEDYERLAAHKWTATWAGRGWYAHRCSDDGVREHTYMHDTVFGPHEGGIDHRDRNGLNNQRANLRAATRRQNAGNARKQIGRNGKPCSSRYKGVYRVRDRFVAQIRPAVGERLHLGTFTDEVAAALAYDLAAIEVFGEFARGNFLTAQAGSGGAAANVEA